MKRFLNPSTKQNLQLHFNQVSYSQLIQFSLTAAQDSIQAAIAGEAHVSALRIVDIFLSSASQTAGVDVWFVLLQKPKLDLGEAIPSGAGNSTFCNHLNSLKRYEN